MPANESYARFGNAAEAPSFSIVICSINATFFRNVCDNYQRLFAGRTIEIIGIHDARSLAEGYNRGIARAVGDYLILSHDDIAIITPDFADRLTRHLAKFDLVGIAGTTKLVGGAWFLAGFPHNYQLVALPLPENGMLGIAMQGPGPLVIPDIQALDGVFMATRMEVARDIAFDDETFDHFHLYDIDFSFRAFRHGYRLAVCRDLFIVHASKGDFGAMWGEHRVRFEAKFAEVFKDRVEAVQPKVTQVRFDPAMLKDPEKVKWLCSEESIAGLLGKLRSPEKED